MREVEEAGVRERTDIEFEGAEGGELGKTLEEIVSDLGEKRGNGGQERGGT